MFNDILQHTLIGTLQSLMQILQYRCSRSDLPMSNEARKQLGLQAEKLRTVYKNECLPSHDLHIGQDVMYQDATSKWSYPATITSLCVGHKSYKITTRNDVSYRKTQAHLKPYQPQCKKTENEHSDNDMQTLKANHKQFDNVKVKRIKCNIILDQREILCLLLNLICDVLNGLCNNKLDISHLKQIAHKWLPNRG